MNFAEPSWTREIDAMTLTLLFEAHERDLLPYPIRYQFEGGAEAYLQAREAATRWLEVALDEATWNAVDFLLFPQTRIESVVFTGRNSERRHEFHAALRDGQATILARQHDRPNTLVLTHCGISEALVRAVAFLPETGAGRLPALRCYRSELDRQPHSWLDQNTPQYRMQEIFRRPRSGWGEIRVEPGIAYDARPTPGAASLLWCDYPNDGRYYVENGTDVAAEPMNQEQLHYRLATIAESMHQRDQVAR